MSSPGVVYPPPGYNYTPYYNNPVVTGPQFNPTIAVIIIVLIGGCFVLGFISVFVRKCMTDETAMPVRPPRTTSGTRTVMTWTSKSRGLDQNSVDALPIVHRKDLDETDDFDCPVCLTEFEPEDSLRLLPVCKHVFHQDCIDAWFESHSTCPLCRASLTLRVMWPERREPVESVAEVLVNRDSDSDVGLQPVHDADREDSQIDVATVAPPPSAVISPEDERNSASGTSSRHSQSFKCEAGGTTALEKAASPEAQSSKPPTDPGSKKPPLTPSATTGIRRASSVGTDLVALRNLLTGGDQNASVNSYRLDRARTAVPKVDAPVSTSWFARPRSTDLGARGQTLENGHSSPSAAGENWSSVDLESGNHSTAGASTSKGESSTSAVPEPAWSDRWSLASLRSAMFPLSRSTSDVTPNANPHLPA